MKQAEGLTESPDQSARKSRQQRFSRSSRWLAGTVSMLMSTSVLALMAPAAQAAPNTIITLTFDDANSDQVAAAATMNAKGLHGTFFTPSGYMNSTGYMSTTEVQALQAAGNEIGGHTVTHPDLAQMDADEVARQVCNDRVNLTNWGLKITDFAYPFASLNPTVKTIVQNCGFNSARGLGDLRSKVTGSSTLPFAETIPPADPYDTAAPDEVDNTWTLKDLQDLATNAENNGGGWVQVTFHHIGTGTTDPLTVTPALFDQYTTWLKAEQDAGRLQVKTVGDVIGGPVKPLVNGPAAPPAITSGNLLHNPRLEFAGPAGTGLPQCWAAGFYDTNTPVFTTTGPGHLGNVAELVTMSGYASGDAKLLPTQDLGQCAPTAVPGHSYLMKAWYKSTVPTQFEVYYRTGIGTWQYWTASPQYAASADWTETSWTTPPVPDGATAISFGLNIMANGTLTTDDYELYDTAGLKNFSDVTASNLFYNEIGWLSGNSISTGWTDGTFRPVQPIARDAMAAFIYRLKGSPAYTPPAASYFNDVAPTDQFYKEISWLHDQQITTGYTDGGYHPAASVNRDAMAAFMYRLDGKPAYTPPASPSFTDVPTDNLFYNEISWLASTHITTGYPDGTYQPGSPVNRDAMAAFMYRFDGNFPRN